MDLSREFRVAFSLKAQPIWFRLLKWAIIIGLIAANWRNPRLWSTLGIVFVLSLALHFFWRWKTKGWTQPWGGWDDVEAALRSNSETR